MKVESDPHVYYELADQFTFDLPNSKYMPSCRNRYWDGKIRLFNVNTKEIYVGLLDKIIKFCKDYNYTFEFKNNQYYGLPFEENSNVTPEGVKDYINHISKYPPRDYQIKGVTDALKYNRKLVISPTGSGKSLMIYSIVRYHVHKEKNVLIIVPTTSLVEQMYKDFKDYGWDSEKYCHKIYAGKEKNPLWIYVTTDDGKKYKFEGNEYIHLVNNRKKLAKKLEESDEIDDRWLSAINKK